MLIPKAQQRVPPTKAETVSHNTSTPSPSGQPSLGELVARISENVSGLVRGEIDLAKAKAKVMGAQFGMGAGLLAAAGVLALYALGFLLHAIVRGLSNLVPTGAALLIVSVVLFIITAVLALIGVKRLKAGQRSIPDPQAGLKRSAETLKTSFSTGLQKGQHRD